MDDDITLTDLLWACRPEALPDLPPLPDDATPRQRLGHANRQIGRKMMADMWPEMVRNHLAYLYGPLDRRLPTPEELRSAWEVRVGGPHRPSIADVASGHADDIADEFLNALREAISEEPTDG